MRTAGIDIDAQDGVRTNDPALSDQLTAQGYERCPTPSCDFHLSPQTRASVEGDGGYFTCPACKRSSDLMQHLPWHGVGEGPWGESAQTEPGGNTIIGIPLADQSQIGENLVVKLGELPGYGPITWWHPGGATANSPLDGATKDWGIEVKTIGYDAAHHRFIPGRAKEKADKNQQAQEMGLRGILGVLVILDYRRDVADIYVKEMPLEPWERGRGQYAAGVAAFRKNTAQRLVAEVPFPSPYKDPSNPSPVRYSVEDYYQKPEAPGHANTPASEMPF